MRSMVDGGAPPHSASSVDEPQQHVGAGGAVFGRGVFRDVVADAARARHEDHAGRADRGQHLRVVARAARQPLDRQLEVPRDRLDAGNERRRERRRDRTGRASALSTVTLSAAAVSATKAARRRSASLSRALSVLRRSTVITARSATTLTRLGDSVSAPTVAT